VNPLVELLTSKRLTDRHLCWARSVGLGVSMGVWGTVVASTLLLDTCSAVDGGRGAWGLPWAPGSVSHGPGTRWGSGGKRWWGRGGASSLEPEPLKGAPQPFSVPSDRSDSDAVELSTSATGPLYVTKRDGQREPAAFDKITARVRKLCNGLDHQFVDPGVVAQKVVQGIYSGVSTVELDNLAAETAAYMGTEHPDYTRLAARISISNLHKQTTPSFLETMRAIHHGYRKFNKDERTFLNEELMKVVEENEAVIQARLDFERDFVFDYFGFKTLERAYLMRVNGTVVERPQHMWMRVALGIHGSNLTAAFETYDLLSNKWFVHASPTLFHAGTQRPQLSSCFLLTMVDDSISGIYDTLKRCAEISKAAGGIGLSVHKIRAQGSAIRGTNGQSNGLVPMLRVFDSTARYVDQGGGKRPGAFAVYIEPWHADIFDVLELKKNHGKEELRARDLFYALWIPDLFMKRVESDGNWSLLCPDECPGLNECHGEEFNKLYLKYEQEGRAKRVIRAQELWFAILDAQIETGTPYMLYKDACNAKSNQKNLGTIQSSNLCTEIIEYSSPDEVAVCNLASLSLPRFVVQPEDGNGYFDFEQLKKVTKVATRNLNKVIDVNFYPAEEAKRSNLRHRPMGLGVNGLADAFMMLGMPFDSPAAQQLNRDIFETIYFAALEASTELAEQEGAYETYEGSPMSQGEFQFDLWGVKASQLSGRWDWEGLRRRISRHGVRNSLLLAPMPTASTAQILGFNECIEPYTSNLYARRVKAGEFIVVNPHLLQELIGRGMWTPEVKNALVASGGSVQGLDLPDEVKEVYRTVWEIKQRSLIDMAADRGIFIDQSQSLNAFIDEPTYDKLTSLHFYAWNKGLKTGMYYLRTKPAASAIQFTVDSAVLAQKKRESSGGSVASGKESPKVICTDEVCLSCQ